MPSDDPLVYLSAKRYYAEIMMPFRVPIRKTWSGWPLLRSRRICPSHGPVYDKPLWIVDAYRNGYPAPPKNEVVLPYISMHHSTAMLVKRMAGALAEQGVRVKAFDLTVTDMGELAMALVDAATLVVGTPIVLGGAHPLVGYALNLANATETKSPVCRLPGFLRLGGRGGGAPARG